MPRAALLGELELVALPISGRFHSRFARHRSPATAPSPRGDPAIFADLRRGPVLLLRSPELLPHVLFASRSPPSL